MEQVDHQGINNSGINYEMREERQNMGQVASQHRDKNKKAAKHSRTKDQSVRLSKQLIRRSNSFVQLLDESTFDGVPGVADIAKRGRRWMNRDNIVN